MTHKLTFTSEDAHALTIMAGIAVATYVYAVEDRKMHINEAKEATRDSLKNLYPQASDQDITVATANALECFYAWNEYLKVMSEQRNRGGLQ
jgi:hypothetical protein